MNEVLNNIKTRRSIRAFITDKNISKTDLEAIAEAGIYAPSGLNRQTWQFTVIQNQEKIQKLCKVIEVALNREGYDMYKPNAIIITTNDRNNHLGMPDCACALENMFLAAHSLGIGSVWINQLKDCCDEPQVRALLTEFGIPESHIACGIAALGYSDNYYRETVKNTNAIKWVD